MTRILEFVLRNRWAVRTGLVLAIVAAPTAYVYSRTGETRTALDRTLWELGYYPVKPPSNLIAPGSIYQVSRDGKFYVTICQAEEEDIAPFLKTSPSEEMIARELQKTAIAVDTDAAKLLNAELKRDVVESVNYRLSSVKVKEIALERNEELSARMTTDREGCRRAIDRLLAAREFVCQGQSVLAATVEYQLASKSIEAAKVAVDNAETVQATLASKVNTKVDFDQGRFVSGTGLHYGIKVNPTCMARSDDGPRYLPRNRFDRVVNFIQLDVLRW
jgi:hypothetical protein